MRRTTLLLSLFLFSLGSSCSSSAGSPIERIKRDLAQYPEYSVMLQDMRVDGNFFKDYFHRYKLVWGIADGTNPQELTYVDDLTDWEPVSRREYEKYENYLGMVIASKSKEGQVAESQFPPGYQYVGNPRYGQWRTDRSGGSFWEFYGKYALISSLFNMGRHRIYRNDWDSYRTARGAGRPYYGRDAQGRQAFGTAGSSIQRTNPTFYQRRLQRDQARRTRFQDKVKNRVRRSRMSGTRSRSRGFGK